VVSKRHLKDQNRCYCLPGGAESAAESEGKKILQKIKASISGGGLKGPPSRGKSSKGKGSIELIEIKEKLKR